MNITTVRQLNELNQKFYAQVKTEFDRSRQHAWDGWLDLLSLLPTLNQQSRVIDIGCGNGRWGVFLKSQLNCDSNYLGLDSSPELLHLAQVALSSSHLTQTLIKIDVVEQLLSAQPLDQKPGDLVVSFGVAHHIPSQPLRQKFLKNLWDLTKPGGTLIVSFWQFATQAKWISRAVDPSTVGVITSDLDKDDYILDWQKGQSSLRYCHHWTPEEIDSLSANLPSISHHTFWADGPDQHSNYYLVLKK